MKVNWKHFFVLFYLIVSSLVLIFLAVTEPEKPLWSSLVFALVWPFGFPIIVDEYGLVDAIGYPIASWLLGILPLVFRFIFNIIPIVIAAALIWLFYHLSKKIESKFT